MTTVTQSAAPQNSRKLLSCTTCDQLSPHTLTSMPCTRCGAIVHDRKPNSLTHTWAFLISAWILYVPANLMPMMSRVSFAGNTQDTIFSGVTFLWMSGSRMLSILVLTASIIVPLLKMLILSLLLLTVHFRCTRRLRQQTRLYRLLETIGRWSMLDIFVISLLTSLVQAGRLATIAPGPGTLLFACVVVLTMLAAHSFDPRLLWDTLDDHHART